MMKRITLKGGPLNGRSYDVPDNADRIPAQGGSYRLTPKTGQWEPTKAAKPAQARAPRKRETRPKAKPKPTTVENKTGEPEVILTASQWDAMRAPADKPVDTTAPGLTDTAEQS